jgi:CRP/FNR family transcriptional regulator, cyclic AMP receptor protein
MSLFSHDRKMEALRRAPLFEGLSRGELIQLARVTEDLEVPAGRVLCRESEIGHEFFVIVDGEVEITRQGERVSTAGSGDFFGEIAVIEEIPRMATVTATTPLRFFVLRRQDFHKVLETSPTVERKVLRALARRVVELSGDPTVC